LTEQQRDFPEFYITSPQPCPYLPGRRERKVFTHLTPSKPADAIDHLLRTGFRRSQNIAYTPYCDGCNACVSVRVLVDEFVPGRSFRRTMEQNRDVVGRRQPAVASSEQYDLFRDYVAGRHSDGGMADMSVGDYASMIEDSQLETCLFEYRRRLPGGLSSEFHKWPLVGAALCDTLSDGISMVYSFYDSREPVRGLGTYMILDQIAVARRLGLPYVYLGYWIEGSKKMSYKARFRPQERLTHVGWGRVSP
jgi:leucyl-tRNA---protein transferase